MTRTAKLLLAPLFLLQILFFTFVAHHRFIDRDEGFYLLASRLVLTHKKPYLDFFYTQAPLLPYVYAIWMKATTVSWTSAKLFSVLLTVLLGMLLYEHVCHETRNWLAGVSAVVLFAANTLVFAWFPMVKTYSLAGLLLFSAYVIVSRLSARSPRWLTAAGGLLFGLSVDTRSYLLLLIPVFLWWIFHNSAMDARITSILWFLGGFTIGVAPCLFLFIPSPDAFLFDNLGYHAVRTGQGLVGAWREKCGVLLQLFPGGLEGNGVQWGTLIVFGAGSVFSISKRGYAPRLAFQIAIILVIISLLPTPTRAQYFCLCVPFLIVSAVCALTELFARLDSRRERLVASAGCILLLVLYLAVSLNDFRMHLATSDGVPLEGVIKVSQAIDQITSPGEIVASIWPGYIFQTKTDPFPGLESDFGLPISEKLTVEQRTRYHIPTMGQIDASLAGHTPRVVVVQALPADTAEDLRTMQRLADTFRSSLSAHGYTLVGSIGDISIYAYSSKP